MTHRHRADHAGKRLCVRKEENSNETKVENVVRHFVDYPVSAIADPLQAFDVFIRQAMRQTRIGFFRPLLLRAALYLASDTDDIGKLAGARDAGMAGGDLLDEAGP